MKYGKMLMLVVVGILLFAGIAPAAELTVTIQGTGDGIVYGEGIDCGGGGEDCTETYPDETILHLEAAPDEYSEFKGWLVDGESQKGTLIIRKDIIVTAIFEKIPIPEFEIVSTRPSEFDYVNDSLPLYDTKRKIVGAIQPTGSEDEIQWRVIIQDKTTLTIRMLDAVVIPIHGDRVVAYGDYSHGFDETVGLTVSDLNLYSLDGMLLKSIKVDVNSPFCVAAVSHEGDFWVAGSRGYTVHDPFVLRRYTPDGELMWEQPLPDNHPMRLALSPDSRYATLILQNPVTDHTIIRVYGEDGSVMYEQELPPFFHDVEFISDQEVLLYSSSLWGLYQLDNLQMPLISGKFVGNPFGLYPIMAFPAKDCFLVRTAVVNKKVVIGYHLQAVHMETGRIFAERLFDAASVQKLEFFRVTDQESFEVLVNGDTIMELRIPE